MKNLSLLLALLIPLGCGGKASSPRASIDGPVELDLIRPWPGAEKIYIQATLPDGEPGIFLIDTGAATSVLSDAVAERLGIEGQDLGGTLSGLGGVTPWLQAELPWISLGGLVVEDLEIAVGTPGLPEYAGWIPIAGILGNNVWGNFEVAIDYPADVIELGPPGTIPPPGPLTPMAFDGQHLVVPVIVHAGDPDDETISRTILLELDTGARRLLLTEHSGPGFEPVSTEGEEPIFGIGASDLVPVSAFYRKTRRVPVQYLELGGARVEDPGPGIWINYDTRNPTGPQNMLGLIGHAAVEQHRLYLNFPGSEFALVPSEREPRQIDGHQIMLEQDLERYGNTSAARGLFRAKMRLALEDTEAAQKDLASYLKKNPGDPEATVLQARIHRYEGDLEGYLEELKQVSPGALVDEDELLAASNSFTLAGDAGSADALASAAVEERSDEAMAHLALADVRFAASDIEGAADALAEASALRQNPDAFLIRRARIALERGDDYAALSYLRKRLQLYPSDGVALWFYAMQATEMDDPDIVETFREDMDRALARLHLESRPLDFALAASRLLGDDEQVALLYAEGLDRDCDEMDEDSDARNCRAWYRALAGLELEAAQADVEQALAEDPFRADYLDTLAMVHFARGELSAAAAASLEAARFSPDAIYHLWQAERLQRLADRAAPAGEEVEGSTPG